MSNPDTKRLDSPGPRRSRQRRQRTITSPPPPPLRTIPIGHPDGPARYLGQPLYFAHFDPEDLVRFVGCKVELEHAEERGELEQALGAIGLTSVEQWWHIEASFWQKHLSGGGSVAHGTPTPNRLRQTDAAAAYPVAAPVSFEVYCEIAGGQAAWAENGRDPFIEALDYFLLEPHELRAIELYWSRVLSADRELARRFARQTLTYKRQFSGG